MLTTRSRDFSEGLSPKSMRISTLRAPTHSSHSVQGPPPSAHTKRAINDFLREGQKLSSESLVLQLTRNSNNNNNDTQPFLTNIDSLLPIPTNPLSSRRTSSTQIPAFAAFSKERDQLGNLLKEKPQFARKYTPHSSKANPSNEMGSSRNPTFSLMNYKAKPGLIPQDSMRNVLANLESQTNLTKRREQLFVAEKDKYSEFVVNLSNPISTTNNGSESARQKDSSNDRFIPSLASTLLSPHFRFQEKRNIITSTSRDRLHDEFRNTQRQSLNLQSQGSTSRFPSMQSTTMYSSPRGNFNLPVTTGAAAQKSTSATGSPKLFVQSRSKLKLVSSEKYNVQPSIGIYNPNFSCVSKHIESHLIPPISMQSPSRSTPIKQHKQPYPLPSSTQTSVNPQRTNETTDPDEEGYEKIFNKMLRDIKKEVDREQILNQGNLLHPDGEQELKKVATSEEMDQITMHFKKQMTDMKSILSRIKQGLSQSKQPFSNM